MTITTTTTTTNERDSRGTRTGGRMGQGSFIEKESRQRARGRFVCCCCCVPLLCEIRCGLVGWGWLEGRRGGGVHSMINGNEVRGGGGGKVACWPTERVQVSEFDRVLVDGGMGMRSWLKEGEAGAEEGGDMEATNASGFFLSLRRSEEGRLFASRLKSRICAVKTHCLRLFVPLFPENVKVAGPPTRP